MACGKGGMRVSDYVFGVHVGIPCADLPCIVS